MTWRELYRLGILLPIAGGDGGTEGNIGVDEPATIDKRVDTRTHAQPTSTLTVHREVMTIGDPTTDERIADVTNADPGAGVDGLVVRMPAGDTNIGNVDVASVPAPLSTTGGGTEATALRVTVATDSTGVVSVDDNGGSLTVDNAALSVVGGGVEASALRVTLANDSTGLVSVDDNGGSLTVDNAALSVVGGGVEASALRVTIANDSTGVVSVDDNGGALTVDGTVAVSSITTSVTPGTAAGNLGKAEDAAHASADTGVYVLAVRDDSPAAHSGTDADYESLHVNPEGGLWTTLTPSTQGGLLIFRSLDLDETEEDVKTSAGQLYGYYMYNNATSTRYVKLYNATAATVVVGTTTPVITIPIPSGSAANVEFSHGIAFSTAICAAATTGVADADTGAPAANDVIVNLFYK